MFTVRQFEARTLSWWVDQDRVIDFDPPYQRRGGLWSPKDKAFLIDSILNGYDIPKIYVADFTFGSSSSSLNPRNRHYAVIDGKQRFEAISDFVEGRISLNKDFAYSEDPSLSLGGLGYKDLKNNYPTIASRFDNYNLAVMSVITNEEGRINELFVRLNRNKTLTGPEIRNAMQGLVPELIRALAGDALFKDKIRFATNRGQDLDIAAKFLLVEFRGRLVETKRVVLDRFVEEGVNADAGTANFERAADRVSIVLERMNGVFLEKDVLLSTQGPLVPYYWLIRALPLEDHRWVRPFLLAFQKIRSENRALASHQDTAGSADPTLLRYDAFNRSINDQGSIEGRFEILLSQFKSYVQRQGER